MVAGSFELAGSVAVPNIARYNPATNAWFALKSFVPSDVYCMTPLPGGDVLVGGGPFPGPSGPSQTTVARVNPFSGAWSEFGQGSGPYVRPATSCPGRTASFSTTPSDSGPFTYQWRKESTVIDIAVNFSAGSGTLVLMMIQETDAAVYDCVATGACGTVITTAATLTVTICPCSIADIAGGGPNGDQPDGQITGADFAAFIAAFGGGEMPADTAADVAGGGDDGLQPDGTIDGNDFIAFINAFLTGCEQPLPGG